MTTAHDVTNERHRADCAECQALWTELEAIGTVAAQLPTLTPSRDLWAGIESRLGAQESAGASSTQATVRNQTARWYRRPPVRMAIAASLLVTVTSAVTWQLAGRGGISEPADGARTAAVGGSELYLASLDASTSAMDRDIAVLQELLDERRAELDATTVEVLTRSLQTIDAAIAEARAALAEDPASTFLAQQYTAAYARKLTLLRDATTLPTGL